MDTQIEDVGARIKETRTRMNFTQAEFAKKLGVSTMSQGYYEQNRRKPNADYLTELVRLNVDVEYILTGRKSNKPESSVITEMQRMNFAREEAAVGDDKKYTSMEALQLVLEVIGSTENADRLSNKVVQDLVGFTYTGHPTKFQLSELVNLLVKWDSTNENAEGGSAPE